MNGAERSECCCAEDDFKDNGLDSTMSISIYDQGGPTQRTSRRQASEREDNQINSQRGDRQAYKDLLRKKRKDELSLGRKYVSRNALSQMNYKDLEAEQDMQKEYDIEDDEENLATGHIRSCISSLRVRHRMLLIWAQNVALQNAPRSLRFQTLS